MENVKKLTPIALLALFLLNTGYYFDLAMVPAWEAVYGYYADQSMSVLNFISTGPQFFVFLGTLACTVLIKRISKKDILVGCFAVYTICALVIGISDNIYYFAVMRSLMGFSAGGLLPVAIALITEFYHDNENKLNALVGAYNGVGAVVGSLITLIAGYLCVSHWQGVFKTYWVAIPILLLLIFCVPRTPAEKDVQIDGGEKVQSWSKLGLIATCAGMFIISVFYVICVIQISFFVGETSLGDASLTGVYSSLMTLCGAVGAFAFPLIYKYCKRGTAVLMYLIMAVGFLLFYVQGSIIVTGIAVGCCGFIYSLSIPYYMMYVTKVVPPAKASTSITLVSAALAIGAAVSAYIFTAFMGLTGLESHAAALPLVGYASLAGAVISLILTAVQKRKQAGLEG